MNQEIKDRIEKIQNGEVPNGYKKTKVGIVPDDWEVKKLSQCLEEYKLLSNDINKYNVYSSTRKGLILKSEYYEQKKMTETNLGYKVVPIDYITYRHMSDDDIFYFNMNKTKDSILVSSEYPVFTNNEMSLKEFIIPLLNNTKRFRFFCKTQKIGGTRTRLYFKNLCEYMIAIPNIEEQEKIANILTKQDEIIDLKEKLVIEKETRKKYVMQQLLTGEKRLSGFSGEWQKIKLKTFCCVKSGYAFKSNNFKKIGMPIVRISNLGVEKVDLFNCVYYEKIDIKKEFIVSNGDVLIAMSGATTGKVSEYRYKDIAFLNQRVGKFVLENDGYSYIYMKHIIKSELFSKKLKTMLATGAQPNISSEDLVNMSFVYPELDEQTAIANILSKLNKEIELLKEDVEAEKQKKKSLMQLLLTGIVRV